MTTTDLSANKFRNHILTTGSSVIKVHNSWPLLLCWWSFVLFTRKLLPSNLREKCRRSKVALGPHVVAVCFSVARKASAFFSPDVTFFGAYTPQHLWPLLYKATAQHEHTHTHKQASTRTHTPWSQSFVSLAVTENFPHTYFFWGRNNTIDCVPLDYWVDGVTDTTLIKQRKINRGASRLFLCKTKACTHMFSYHASLHL